VCRPSGVYSQYRYRHPITGKWVAKNLGKVALTDFELQALAEARLDAIGPDPITRSASVALNFDYDVLEPIRTKARKLAKALHAGIDPKSEAGPGGITLAQALALHLVKPRQRTLSQRSAEYYKDMLRRYLSDYAKVPLRRIDNPTLVKLFTHIEVEYGHVAAVMSMRTLSAVWNTGTVHDGELRPWPRGVVVTAGRPPRKAEIMRDLSQFLSELGAAPLSPPRRDFYLLGLLTGLRKGDLQSIKRKDIDLSRAMLHVPKPKGGKAFDLPLSKAALKIIKRALLRAGNSPWLFPSSSKTGHIADQGPRSGDGFSVEWSPHDLRRVFHSVAAKVGTPKYHIDLLVNHALPENDVSAGYISLDVEDLRPWIEKIAKALRAQGLKIA
jgi:integrase